MPDFPFAVGVALERAGWSGADAATIDHTRLTPAQAAARFSVQYYTPLGWLAGIGVATLVERRARRRG